MDLHGRRRIGVFGEAGLGRLTGQHGAGAGVAQRPVAGDAPQRGARLPGVLDRRGGVEQRVEGGVEGRVRRQCRAVERRHGVVAGAGQDLGVGRPQGRGRAGWMPAWASARPARRQEGAEVAVVRIGAQPQAPPRRRARRDRAGARRVG